ncbi:hypothetical protein [Streptomyces sp. NPDC058595]|uniref:hypothetical protein n=1 Tax=Streptomyces sp. NPDC058595 TaxID=3346550 RepID=UPI00365BB51F
MTMLIGVLLLAGRVCQALRRLTVSRHRCPPLAWLGGSGAATAAVERRLADQLQTRQIDEAAYRRAMNARAGGPPL